MILYSEDTLYYILITHEGDVVSHNTVSEPEREIILGDGGAVLLVFEVHCLIHRDQQPED